MKKREIVLVSIMGILTIAIVLFGYKYAVAKKEALLNEGEKQTETVAETASSQESIVAESDTSEACAVLGRVCGEPKQRAGHRLSAICSSSYEGSQCRLFR